MIVQLTKKGGEQDCCAKRNMIGKPWLQVHSQQKDEIQVEVGGESASREWLRRGRLRRRRLRELIHNGRDARQHTSQLAVGPAYHDVVTLVTP